MEIKEISEYGDKWDNIARLFIVSIVILIVHKVRHIHIRYTYPTLCQKPNIQLHFFKHPLLTPVF